MKTCKASLSDSRRQQARFAQVLILVALSVSGLAAEGGSSVAKPGSFVQVQLTPQHSSPHATPHLMSDEEALQAAHILCCISRQPHELTWRVLAPLKLHQSNKPVRTHR